MAKLRFDENQREVGKLNPMSDKNETKWQDDTCDHILSRRLLRVLENTRDNKKKVAQGYRNIHLKKKKSIKGTGKYTIKKKKSIKGTGKYT